MLMKDSIAVSNQWFMLVNFLGGAVLFDPWFVKYSFHIVVQYEIYLICIFMNINEILKMRTKSLD